MRIARQVAVALGVLLTTTAFGQSSAHLTDAQLSESGASRMHFAAVAAGCGVADSLAKMDIAKQLPFLLLVGGIAPVAYMPTDAVVEQKFQFHYYEYGCFAPDEACIRGYNQQVFNYLTSKYGKKWVKAVRPDVVGLKDWKKAH